MRLTVPALALASMLLVSFAAQADPITYSVSGTINAYDTSQPNDLGTQQGTVSGTYTFDTTTHTFTGVDLTYLYTPTNATYHYTTVTGLTYSSYNTYPFYYTILGDTSGNQYAFAAGDAYLEIMASSPYALCTLSAQCPGGNASNLIIDSATYPNIGTGTSVAATPEPSSLVLLGTSALGVAGLMRRKFRIA